MAFTITKNVRPNAVWQEMYLQIQRDQRVILSATGIWSPEMRPVTIVWCGPDGIEGRLANEEYLLPGANVGSLIAKIGNDNPVQAVGNYFDFYSAYEGPLFMAMNEKPEFHNQAGSVDAQIVLFDL